jgi:hypothetical protein
MILNNATNAAVAQEATNIALRYNCQEKKSAAERLGPSRKIRAVSRLAVKD